VTADDDAQPPPRAGSRSIADPMNTSGSRLRWLLRGGSGSAIGLQTLGTNLARLALGVVTGVLTARLLGPHGRGELAALVIWPQAFAYAATLGIPAGITFEMRLEAALIPSILGAGLILSLALGTIACVAGIVFVPLLLTHEPSWVVTDARWLMPFALLGLLSLSLVAAFQGLADFGRSNMLALSLVGTTVVGLVLLGLTSHLTPTAAALVTLGAALPAFLLMSYQLHRIQPMSFRRLLPAARRLVSYGARSYPLDLLGTLGALVDQAIVTVLLGPVALAFYVVALRGSRVLTVLPSSAQPVLFVKASGTAPAEVGETVGFATRIIFLAMLVAGVLTGVFAPLLVRVLYGARFRPAVPALELLIAEAILTSTGWMLAQAFFALNRPGTISLLQIPALAALTGLLFWLTPRYGLLGAATALLITGILRLVMVLAAYPLLLQMRVPRLVPGRGDLIRLRRSVPSLRTSRSA
jgi:O-antigen/teichoic acid export membrane protein